MAYNNFTLSKVKKDFDLVTVESENLFKDVGSIEPTALLIELLEEYLPLARAISTEKAKSELLVIPILVEIRKILFRKISLFSGSLFNVDIFLGLTGYVDFLITLLFLKLEDKTVYIDNQEYYIDNLGKIMGILVNCLEKAAQ